MRIVVAGIHPVGIHGAQVLNLEFKERLRELIGVAEFQGKGICNVVRVLFI